MTYPLAALRNIIIEIGALTDPDRDEYTRFLPPDLGSTLPDGVPLERKKGQGQGEGL